MPILAANSFMPHGICYLWKPGLVGLHLVSDAIIALSYFSIPITLVYIIRKRKDLPFSWVFALFAAFIISCGSGHVMDIWTLWHPNYWLSGYIRAITALVSIGTAIALIDLVPAILSLPSPAQLEEVNRRLNEKIQEKTAIEAELLKERQFLQAMLDNLSEGIVACNSEGVLTLFNRSTQEFHGLPQETIVADRWADYYSLYSADGKTALSREEIPLYRALQGESVRDVEMTIVPENSQPRILLASGAPIITSKGEKLGAVVVMRDITERKRAEEALKKSEERWQLILRGTGDGIFDWDILTGEVFMSSELKASLGYEDREVENNFAGWRDRLHPEDLDRTVGCVQAYLEKRIPQYLVEYRLRCKDGSYKWILARGQAQWDEAGTPIRMVGSHQDISQRKAAEAEILRLNQELEQRVKKRTEQLESANTLKDELIIRERQAIAEISLYQDIVENIPIGFCVWHLENSNDSSSFRLRANNPAASRLLGFSMEDEIGKYIGECFPNIGERDRTLLEVYAEIVRCGRVKEVKEVVCSDERIASKVFSVKAFPLPDNCIGVAFEDITARKQVERALIESTRRYRQVVNSVREIIFQTDTEGRWTFLNPAWTTITGFSVLDSLNRSFLSFVFAEEARNQCARQFQSLCAGQQESFRCEFRLQTASEDFRWLEINVQVNRDEENNLLGSCGTISDITDRKQTEAILKARADELAQLNAILLKTTEQLQKRNRELDQFAYVASHDLKAPLRAIANLSQWLEEDLEDKLTPETQRQMNLLRGRVHRLENLIDGLLQYSRVGRIQSPPEVVNIDRLLAEVIDLLSPPPGFTLIVEGEMPTILTEKTPLVQVFTNAIDNAIRHHDRDDGIIKISVTDRGNCYEFSVTDDGPGIAPEYQEKVFAIFQTLEARDKKENTGIGLALIKKIIETHNGKIQLESQGDRGTTLRFTWLK